MNTQKFMVSLISLSMLASAVALPVFADNYNGNWQMAFSSTSSSTASSTGYRFDQLKQKEPPKIEDAREKAFDSQKMQIGKKYEKALADLENLATKTQAVITKLQSNAMDVSTSTSLMTIANSKISVAQADVAALDAVLSQFVPANASSTVASTTRQEALVQIKADAKLADSALKDAKKALTDVIASLHTRNMVMGEHRNGTSTQATSSASTIATSTHKMMPAFHFNWGWFNPMRWFGRR